MIYPLEFNEEKTNLKHNVWFDRLINIQKIFGLTYYGSYDKKSESNVYLKKVLLSLYKIIISILVLYYLLTIGFENSKLYNKTKKKSLLVIVFHSAIFAVVVEQITCKSINFFNGPQILSTIHSFGYYLKPMPILSKVKISLFIIIYCFSVVLVFIYTFNDLNSIIRDLRKKNFTFYSAFLAVYIVV
jgi:hypothetical protein